MFLRFLVAVGGRGKVGGEAGGHLHACWPPKVPQIWKDFILPPSSVLLSFISEMIGRGGEAVDDVYCLAESQDRIAKLLAYNDFEQLLRRYARLPHVHKPGPSMEILATGFTLPNWYMRVNGEIVSRALLTSYT